MAYKWHVFRLSIENMWTCVKMDLRKDKRSIWAVLRFAVPRTLKHQESASIVKQDSWVANYVSCGLINPCSRQMYMTYPTQEAAECRCLYSSNVFLSYWISSLCNQGLGWPRPLGGFMRHVSVSVGQVICTSWNLAPLLNTPIYQLCDMVPVVRMTWTCWTSALPHMNS